MNSRKKIAITIFVLGVLGSLLYVPMTICQPLGFRGTSTSETYCVHQGYYPLMSRPTKPHNAKRQIRIDHKRMGITWAILLLLCILIGTDYSSFQKK